MRVTSRRSMVVGSVLLGSLMLGACSSGSNGGNGTGPNPGIQVTVSPPSLSVVQGGSGTITVTLSRAGGFAGAVAITVTGLPAGITFSVVPDPITGSTTSAVVTVNVASSVAPGTYPASVRASASGVSDATASYTITVTGAPNYSLSIAPPALSIQQGANSNATVTINRVGGFAGAVTLSLDNPPDGITGNFAPNNTTGNTSTLTVNVAAAVAAGNYQLTIKGAAQGLPDLIADSTPAGSAKEAAGPALAPGDRTVPLALTVTLPPATPVEYQFCSAEFNAIFFAFQDGNGPWTRVTSVLESGVYKYRFELRQGWGGVYYVQQIAASLRAAMRASAPTAWPRHRSGGASFRESRPARPGSASVRASANGSEYITEVLRYVTGQHVEVGLDFCPVTGFDPGKTVTVPFTNVPAGQYGVVGLGGQSVSFANTAPSPILTGVRSGLTDLVGSRAPNGTNAANRVVKLNNVEPADGSVFSPVVDYLGGSSWAPGSAIFTYNVPPGSLIGSVTGYYTGNGFAGFVNAFSGYTAIAGGTLYGFPAAQVLPNEVHELSVAILPPGATDFEEFRVVDYYQGMLQNRTVTPLSPINLLNVNPVDPALRLYSVSGDVPAEVDYAEAFLEGGGGTVTHNLDRSAEYAAASGAAANGLASLILPPLAMPNLTALPGFPTASLLPAGTVDVSLFVVDWTGATRPFIFPTTPPIGLVSRLAGRTMSFTAP